METLEKLGAIDEADFETLVVLYLRQLKPELRSLIQTGINAKGKSIKCPVDAVLKVQAPQSRLVHVAVTVYEPEGIRRKWLGGKKARGKGEPGDIKKAEEEFDTWDKSTPRKLYLAWNRPLANDTELYRAVQKRCESSGMEVEIIEASQLVPFLDYDPEGQFLRQEFLGIDAGRLSENLLRQISQRSLVQHLEAFGSPSYEERVEITREAGPRLANIIDRSGSALIGVIGTSGTGKSTLVRQYGMKLNAQGGLCLWTPAEELIRNISPATLLLRVLKRFQPSLNERAGDDALDIAAEIPGGLLLLTDDVNRLPSPHVALEAAKVCARVEAKGRTEGGSTPRIRFITPLWPGQLPGSLSKKKSEWETVELDFYTDQERMALAQAHAGIRPTDLLPLIDALNGDPFLCGLGLSLRKEQTLLPAGNRATLLKTIIEDVLNTAAQEATREGPVRATPEEFVEALDGLVELMLRAENPEPPWADIRQRLGTRPAELLLALGRTNQLGWVNEQLESSHWRWKHDRLRDALMGRWLAKRITSDVTQWANTEDGAMVLNMPGTAEAWAWSLAFAEPNQTVGLVNLLASHQPLGLAEALSIVQFPEGSKARRALIEGLRSSLDSYEPDREGFVVPPGWPVLHNLARADEPIVLEVTETLKRNWYVYLARFRNGDTQAGLQLLNQDGGWYFHLTSHFPMLERAVEAYARANDSRRSEVARDLAGAACDANQVAAIVTLCGYLARGELAQTAWDVWNTLDETSKQAMIVPLVWTLSRCADSTMQDKLEAALLRVRDLDDEDRVEGNVVHASDRYDHFMEPLGLALRWEITPASAETWARVTTDQDDLRNSLLYLLRVIDQPSTIEAYVRLTSINGGTFIDHMEAAVEPGDDDRRDRERVPVTPAARTRLWQIIESDESENVRKVAFLLWKRFPVPDDVELLRSLKESDALFNEALKVRLRLRDRTAAPLLIERMKSGSGEWSPYAYALYYEDGVADALFENLETALNSDPIHKQYVERIARYLPPDGVRRLVLEKRELLLNKPRMWNALWRSDVPEALEFLQQAIPQANKDDLRYMFWMLNGNSYPVTQRMLDALVPVLHHLTDKNRSNLAMLLVNAGRADWAESHDLRRVTQTPMGKLRNWLNEEDAITTFNAAARTVPLGVNRVRRTPNFYEIERQGNKISFDTRVVLKRWLGPSPESNKVIVAAMLLARIGTGADVGWWEELMPDRSEPTYEPWSNTQYILRRRRWHKHD